MKHTFTIFYAIFLQGITVPFLLFSDPIRIARMGILYDMFPSHVIAGFLMLFAVILALLGVYKAQNGNRFYFFLPQWFFLILTSGSALFYVTQGHYADGVMRPWQFIFLDQLPSFIAVVLYTVAIFNFTHD